MITDICIVLLVMLRNLDQHLVIKAIRKTGEYLIERGIAEPIPIIIAGGVAALLGQYLSQSRTTGDCDVLNDVDDDTWAVLQEAVAKVASDLNLPKAWLNRESRIYQNCFALGWEERAVAVGRFGPLDVRIVSRKDLIASKIVSAIIRQYDYEDLRSIKPTLQELDFASDHLDRLEAEDLDAKCYDNERAILESLREGHS